METKHDFVYDNGLNRLKWTGTEENLRGFVEEFVKDIKGWSSGKWEEDRSHNMLTYKVSSIVFKWYNSTKTVLIQGKDHLELKNKLLSFAEVSQTTSSNQQAQVDESITDCTISDDCPSPSQLNHVKINTPSACSLCSVLSNETESVKFRMIEMSERLSTISEHRASETSQDSPDFISLRAKCEIYEEKIKTLEEERSSLLLVISLLA